MTSGLWQWLLLKASKAYLQLLKSYEGQGRDCSVLYLRKESVILPARWGRAVPMAGKKHSAICFREATLAPPLLFFTS